VTRYAPLFVALLIAAPAAAAPITTNLTGNCVQSLPATGATWQSTSHFRFAVFWDYALDCAPTVANGYAPYVRFDNFDGLGSLRIEMFTSALYACKKHQIDWQEVLEDGSLGALGAIIINPGLNGACSGRLSPPLGPPIESPKVDPPPVSVPETGTLLMLFIAAGVLGVGSRLLLPEERPTSV
jgi:hypothetical protein